VGDSKMHLIRDFVSVRHCLRRRALRRERITVRAGANISFGGPGGLPGEPYGQAPDNNILHGLSSSSSTSSIRNDIPSFANEAMRGSPWNRLAARLVRHTTLAFPLLVSAGVVLAVLYPPVVIWFQGEAITHVISIAMFAIGLTLTKRELLAVTRNYKALLVGLALQWTTMPLLGVLVGHVLQLPPDAAAGLVVVACCPGGTSSNLTSFVAHGSPTLSVLLTFCSTAMAGFLTPLLTGLILSTSTPIPTWSLIQSNMQMVVVPLLVALGLRQYLPRSLGQVAAFSPLVSAVAMALICSSIIGQGVRVIRTTGMVVPTSLFIAGAVLHSAGYVLGYIIPRRLLNFDQATARTLSLEVGTQNSALGVVLAHQYFASSTTAFTCAVSAMCHTVIGSLFAGYWQTVSSQISKPSARSPAASEAANRTLQFGNGQPALEFVGDRRAAQTSLDESPTFGSDPQGLVGSPGSPPLFDQARPQGLQFGSGGARTLTMQQDPSPSFGSASGGEPARAPPGVRMPMGGGSPEVLAGRKMRLRHFLASEEGTLALVTKNGRDAAGKLISALESMYEPRTSSFPSLKGRWKVAYSTDISLAYLGATASLPAPRVTLDAQRQRIEVIQATAMLEDLVEGLPVGPQGPPFVRRLLELHVSKQAPHKLFVDREWIVDCGSAKQFLDGRDESSLRNSVMDLIARSSSWASKSSEDKLAIRHEGSSGFVDCSVTFCDKDMCVLRHHETDSLTVCVLEDEAYTIPHEMYERSINMLHRDEA